MSLMGVDVGTTGVKAAVFDAAGNLLAQAGREYPLLFPFPGAAELDPHTVIEAALAVIAHSAGAVRDSDPVRALAIASQGEAFTPLDANGSFLANAMVSSDARAAHIVAKWGSEFGLDRLYRITGHTAYPMYSVFKMLWLKEHQPDVWAKTRKFVFFEDLLAYVLTGETKTDRTLATRSMLYEVQQLQWSREILDAVGLSAEKLPEVLPSGSAIGTVRGDLATRLGLSPDTVVATAGHDQPVGALGCAAASPGYASYSIGTVECVTPAADRLILDPSLMNANLATYPHVVSDTYTTVAFNMTGGCVLRWLRDQLMIDIAREARDQGIDPYDHMIAQASDRPTDLILLPHFGPTGTPHFDPSGVGVLCGMGLSTTRAEILRAFLEGITYEMKWNLEILDSAGFVLQELRAIGGGAKSDIWMQIKADILGIPLTTMQVSEATCMGAALLAGSAIGAFDPKVMSAQWAKPIRTFTPRRKNRQLYDDRFEVYKDIYASLGTARRKLQRIRGVKHGA